MAHLSDSIVATFTAGQATADEIEEVETHLAGCADCRELVAAMAGLASPSDHTLLTPRPAREVANHDGDDDEARPRKQPTLPPGTILAERYRIVHFVAQGGMGEVYAAEDNELRETLALKIPARGSVADADLLARLKREVLLARRIAHPNVCRIFDVGFHRDGARSIVFLTMELLEGETLAAKLRRDGALTAKEALPLAEQLVAGLAAAHDNGVIHRDFKSNNVILVPSDGPSARAVIIDFGLARGEGGMDAFSLGSMSRALVGTPHYLAPEQLQGAPASVATDIHALGVVLFELVTGRLPFLGATAREAAMRRLQEDAPRARSLVPQLSAAWDDVIARCLERDPQLRFADARAVGAALSRRGWRPRRPGWRAAAGLMGALALAWGGTALWHERERAAAARPRPSLAIVDAALWRDDAPWTTTAVADRLTAALAADGDVRLADAATVADAAAERRGDGTSGLPALARRLAVDRVALVDASLGEHGRMHGEVALWSADAAQSPKLLGEDGSFDEIVPRLRSELRAALARPAREPLTLPHLAPERLQLAAEATRRQRVGDDTGAVDRWRRALASGALDADWGGALARALDRLGLAAAARQERTRALAVAEAPRLRRRLTADAARADGHWTQLETLERAAWAEHDDDTTAGFALLAAQQALGEVDGARATLARLRAAPAAERDDTAIDLAAARLALAAGDAAGARTAAAAAVAAARRDGATARLADGRRLESAALLAGGAPEPARTAAEESLALAEQLADPVRASDALATRALVEIQSGQLDAARVSLAYALGRVRALGQAERRARLLLDLAAVARRQGRADDAAHWLDEWRVLAAARGTP
ncbi:MAG TPA: serine/threonine-protein kinase [Polyangia bacterium]|nr:serine/threonine-protein kinase [Polyangia bacterium]